MCFANKSPVACNSSCSRASRKSLSLSPRQRRQPVVHACSSRKGSVTARDAHSAEDWRRPCLVHGQVVEGAIEDGAEDGHIAGLQVRRASWREECEHDVRESAAWRRRWRECWHVPEKDPHCPSLLGFSSFQSGSELQECRRRPAPSDKT